MNVNRVPLIINPQSLTSSKDIVTVSLVVYLDWQLAPATVRRPVVTADGEQSKQETELRKMASCAVKGGCPSDYVAISVSLFSIILLLSKAVAPYLIHKIPRPKGSSLWLVAIQLLASFNLLLSLVMSLGFLRFRRRHWWSSCYIWAVWLEGPFGFGLLLSCRIVQAFQLYNIFVKRRLPPIRSYIFLPLVLLPWISGAACKDQQARFV
ncbi:hypothetical protein ACJIZ3_010372 [Penstemon smallii]|uniref:Uncharacterized protein n=1 Tax=Penstemon smallii TaxID=265156 RepID=A0ABD3TGA9_9LAMI